MVESYLSGSLTSKDRKSAKNLWEAEQMLQQAFICEKIPFGRDYVFYVYPIIILDIIILQ